MTTGGGVQVLGARELRATMKRAEVELDDLKEAHAAAARLVAYRSAAEAPKVSGTLAGNVRGSGAAGAATIRAGGTRVPYANPIHWGWEARNIAPNEFITRAAESTEPQWLHGIYTPAVDRILDRVRGI